jgi:DNA repair exonuclease SbcCD ATPase subunit
VAILDQEEAKKFLKGPPSEKYDFFLKATELARIDRTYRSTKDSMDDVAVNKKVLNNSIEGDKCLARACEEEWDKTQELDKLKEKQEKFVERYAWACYQKAQNTLDLEMMVRALIVCFLYVGEAIMEVPYVLHTHFPLF